MNSSSATHTYRVIFTIKQATHPLTETVHAETVDQATEIVKQLVAQAGVTLKQIVSVVHLA